MVRVVSYTTIGRAATDRRSRSLDAPIVRGLRQERPRRSSARRRWLLAALARNRDKAASASRAPADIEANALPANDDEWMKFDVIILGCND